MNDNVPFSQDEVTALATILRAARLLSEMADAFGGGLGTEFVLALDSVEHLHERMEHSLDPHSRRVPVFEL